MAAKKGGLGKGLEALMGDLGASPRPIFENAQKAKNDKKAAAPVREAAGRKSAKPVTSVDNDFAEGVVYIQIDDIKPNSKQPRHVFNEDALQELADSIQAYGVIQPIIVRRFDNGYELVAGERRWRAARKAGLKQIPAIVRELSEKQNSLIALLENMQREDLNMIEEAQGLEALMRDYGLSQEEAASAVGKSRPYVTNALRLLKLPSEVQSMVESGELTAGHAKAIAGFSGSELQIMLAKKAASEGWSVRKIESYTGAKKSTVKKKSAKNDAFKAVEESLSEKLGTRVLIDGSESRGKLCIEYYSRAELDRIIEALTE